MVQGKGLIGGIGGEEGKVWPLDWLCECGHEFKNHGRTDDIALLACLIPAEIPEPHQPYLDTCIKFRPMDNLSYVEQVAKERQVIQ